MNSSLPPDQLDGIAIIGMAGRFPGARTIEEFWQNLCNSVESITWFSEQQLLEAGLDPETIQNPQYVRAKGVIEGIDLFDAAFFGFSPREARTMDPQQRLFLECAWEALERAGYDPKKYEDRIGVYAGASMNTYMLATQLFKQFSMAGDPVPAILGSDKDFLATRVSYKLNLRGPSITVQTACSTSLVAVHMACQSLLNHECSMALAGGVSVRVPQNVGYLYQGEGIVSPDGHCRAFDAQGAGTVIGEGVGIVVLKRVEDALADKDCIFAIIKGSAINNDGAEKVGYTAPGHAGQVEVIEEALAIAGVEPETISYVEAHGTGTALGDPLELGALIQAYRTSTDAKQFCAIGSVKTNIGHLDAAAGVTGLIKAALALHYKRIPPSLNFEKPNPQIDFVQSPFYVNTTLATWPEHNYPRRAGVSSFGIGGTNVHLVLEEAPEPTETMMPVQSGNPPETWLLPISARNPQALQALLHTYETWPGEHTDLPLHAICAVASLRRAHHEYRLALVGSTHQMLEERARAYRQTEEAAHSTHGASRGKVVFVLPGQGSQWPGMGRALLEQEPIFREQIQRCEAAFRPYVTWSLHDIFSTTTEWQDISLIQPVLFAFQIALAALWQSWGVVPDAIVGHSMGEIAAACIAGILSLEECACIICQRSQLLRRISGKGAMALVGLTRERAEREIIGHEGKVSIAVSNSHHSTVLAGEPLALESIGQSLATQGIFWRYVKVDVASHSPQVDVLRAELLEALQGLQPQRAQVAFYSTVEGKKLTGVELQADYWMRNLREPVQFARTIECLFADEHTLFLELSPHPLLITALQENLEEAGKDGLALPSLRREQNERASMLQTLGTLYEQGLNVDWTALYPAGNSNLPLPTYPFQRERYWIENQEDVKPRLVDIPGGDEHPLLGRHIRSPLSQILFETQFDLTRQSFLHDYRIHDTTAVPATIYAEMAFAAATETRGPGAYTFKDVVIHQQLFLSPDRPQTIQSIIEPVDDKTLTIQIFSLDEASGTRQQETWIRHASGMLQAGIEDTHASISLSDAKHLCQEEISVEKFSSHLNARGDACGKETWGIQQLWGGKNMALARIQWSEVAQSEQIQTRTMPPCLLEIGGQVLQAAAIQSSILPAKERLYVPSSLNTLRNNSSASAPAWCYVTVQQQGQTYMGDLLFFDESGRAIIIVTGLQLQPLPQTMVQQLIQQRSSAWLYQLQWEAKPREELPRAVSAQAGNWIILADKRGVGMALAEQLKLIGDVPFIILPAGEFEKYQQGQYGVNPLLLEDIQHMLADIALNSPLPCKGIVHLWNLDAASTQELTLDSLDRAEKAGCASIIQLIQAIERSGQKPRLWLITRNAQPVADTAISLELAQAPVWGLGQTIAIEHTDIWGGLIDLDANSSPIEDSALLLTEFLSPDGEDQIAYRGKKRYGARLVHSNNPETRPVALKADAIYLVTGGLGYLGLKVADQLVELGARQIWLIGRKGFPEQATDLYECKAIIRALEEKGATVHVIPADVSNPDHIRQIATRLQEASAPLCGIIHAAGVATPREIREMTPQQLQESLRPKVMGTWLLHQLTQDSPLDFFISFSSIVSLWGSRGLAHHAAANRFLDAFAHYRRAHGYPALTINWGPWEGGDHSSSIAHTRLERLGLTSFSVETGKEVLSTLLSLRTAQTAVIQIDWNLFKPGYEAQTSRHLLEHIQTQTTALETSWPVSALSLRLKNAQPAEQRDILYTFVRGEVAAVLGIEQPHLLDARRPLRESGLESLMAVELRNRLQAGIRPTTTLPATIVFEYPTVEALVNFLLQDVTALPDQQKEQATDQTRTQLAEEDLTASLLEELERAGY
jgi:acyl transferase domain-containing protein